MTKFIILGIKCTIFVIIALLVLGMFIIGLLEMGNEHHKEGPVTVSQATGIVVPAQFEWATDPVLFAKTCPDCHGSGRV